MANSDGIKRKLVWQKTIAACHTAMGDLIGQAIDLESVGLDKQGEALREVVGHIENFIANMPTPRSPRS